MQAGWYAHPEHPDAIAYFDGTAWERMEDGRRLSAEFRKTIIPLQPGHPGPPAPFETGKVSVPRRKPGSGWFWGIGVGVLLIVMGFFKGFSSAGSNCGAPFKGNSIAEYMDALAYDKGLGITHYAAQCRADIADAAVATWILIILGVVVTLASFLIQAVIRSGRKGSQTAAAGPTVATQIEDLARLRDKGLVTPEEFESKRQELLRRA